MCAKMVSKDACVNTTHKPWLLLKIKREGGKERDREETDEDWEARERKRSKEVRGRGEVERRELRQCVSHVYNMNQVNKK